MTMEEKIEAIYTIVLELEKRASSTAALAPAASVAAIADAAELDSQYGNPDVRKDPPLWSKAGGASYVGRKFNECPAEFLDALASFFDWKVSKDIAKNTPDGDKYAGYGRKDAARARGWAKRIRDGYQAPKPEAFADGDDNLPF
jgi:hypothetical protein